MGELIAMDSKLPAHIRNMGGFDTDEWESGTTGGYPVISTKGKVFTIRRGDESEVIMRQDDPDDPASSLPLVILKTHPGVAKTYFEGTYEEGSDDKPTCYSPDGIAPGENAEDRQAKKCAICPRNQWGSRITESGKKAKQCSDVKRLAVAPLGQLNDPMLLRVPPTSLKAWDEYVKMLRKRGLTPAHVVTKVKFDPTVAHQSLQFSPLAFVDEEQAGQIEEALREPVLESIVIGDGGHSDSGDVPSPAQSDTEAKTDAAEADFFDDAESDAEDEPPAPKAQPKRKAAKRKAPAKKAAPPPAEVEEPEASADADEGEADFDDIDFDDLVFDD